MNQLNEPITTFLDKADLVTNHYHIPEPQKAKPFVGIPDMVIVPLLAFDEKGYRVGYGKGFYDRFLQNISTQKIGLSFFDGLQKLMIVHLNDIRLDKCITPNRIIEILKIIVKRLAISVITRLNSIRLSLDAQPWKRNSNHIS